MAEETQVTGARAGFSYLVDTSVALKWFVERGEEHVAIARRLRDAYVEHRCSLRITDLLFLELANALTMGHGHHAAMVRKALDFVRGLDMDVIALQPALVDSAVQIAGSFRAAVYDSYFLAAAIASGSILVTDDRAFLRKVAPHPSVLALRELRLAD